MNLRNNLITVLHSSYSLVTLFYVLLSVYSYYYKVNMLRK